MAKKQQDESGKDRVREIFVRWFPAWVLLFIVLAIIVQNFPNLIDYYRGLGGFTDEHRVESGNTATIAPLFTSEIDHWAEDIVRWAQLYGLDPNLVATIIQIESCGDPGVASPAGAQGLMQVMPQHFQPGENPLDPDTNANRGLSVLSECLYSPYNPQADVGLAFACYNGGPSVFVTVWDYWPQQARDYYIWGTGIYADALTASAASDTLDQWLAAGGSSLCVGARQQLGLSVTITP